MEGALDGTRNYHGITDTVRGEGAPLLGGGLVGVYLLPCCSTVVGVLVASVFVLLVWYSVVWVVLVLIVV